MPALPTGTIVLWFGSIATIPGGFVLCNGANGTPDLRDRFVTGAGPLRPVGNTGGAVLHDHLFTGDGHTHTIPAGVLIAAGANFASSVQSSPATGRTDDADGLPPYHSLAYIMKT